MITESERNWERNEAARKLDALQRRVESWNDVYPVGTPVTRYKLIHPLAEPVETKTRTAAEVLSGHSAVVWVEGHAGCVLLESVVPR
jgi:hypothetical protein